MSECSKPSSWRDACVALILSAFSIDVLKLDWKLASRLPSCAVLRTDEPDGARVLCKSEGKKKKGVIGRIGYIGRVWFN